MTEKDLATKLREEAELFDEEDDNEVAEAVWVRPASPRDPSQVYSVRIPLSELEKLRQVADHRGITPSALMRSWVLLRLDYEYEQMLGRCPRCGQPAGAQELTETAAPVATEKLRPAARRSAMAKGATRKVPAKAAAAKKAAPRKATTTRAAPRKNS